MTTTVDMTKFFTAIHGDELRRRQAGSLGRTCSTCAVWWTGDTTCHCTVCHQTFTTAWAFDAHRIGGEDDRVCVNPELIKDGGESLRTVERGGVLAWARPIDEAGRARLEALRDADAAEV